MKEYKYDLAAFAAAYGLQTEKHGCYGIFRGYRVHVKYSMMGNPACVLTIVTDAKGKEKAIEQYLEKNKSELYLSQYGVVGIGLMVCPQLYRGVFRKIEEILNKITAKLAKLGCPGADVCPYCGKPLEGDEVSVRESGIPFQAHAVCANAALSAMRERERRERERPDHKLPALVGLLLGTLAGAAVLILLFLLWNFMAFATAVAVLFGAWLYGRFGGKNTAAKVVLCSVIPLVLLAGVYVLCLYFDAAQAADGAGAWQYIARMWQDDPAYSKGIIVNAVFFVVFDLVAAAYLLFSYLRNRRSIAAGMRVGEE